MSDQQDYTRPTSPFDAVVSDPTNLSADPGAVEGQKRSAQQPPKDPGTVDWGGFRIDPLTHRPVVQPREVTPEETQMKELDRFFPGTCGRCGVHNVVAVTKHPRYGLLCELCTNHLVAVGGDDGVPIAEKARV